MFLFLVRQLPDYDHLAPLVYALRRRGHACAVLCQNPEHPFDEDFLTRFLREEWDTPCWTLAQLLDDDPPLRVMEWLLRRLPWRDAKRRLARAMVRRARRPALLQRMLDRVKPSLIVHDHQSGDLFLTRPLIRLAEERLGVRDLEFPHGMETRLLPVSATPSTPVTHLRAYHAVVHNTRSRDAYVAKGYYHDVALLPCPRYSAFWIDELRRITAARFDWPCFKREPAKLHVVVFGSPLAGIDETHPLLRTLESLEFVTLLYKGKPRPKGDHALGGLAKAPSTRLIQWADVVIQHISGIAFDVLTQGKPLLYPKYLAPDAEFVVDKYGACWTMESEDELIAALRKLHANPKAAPYTQDAVDRLLREQVHGGFEDLEGDAALSLNARHLEGLMDPSRKG